MKINEEWKHKGKIYLLKQSTSGECCVKCSLTRTEECGPAPCNDIEHGYFVEVQSQTNTEVDKTVNPGQGRKYDAGKPMYNLLPADALEEVVMVLTKGAIKYNEPIDQENWRLVENPKARYFAAAQRHLWADKRGEFKDNGEGGTDCYHLACAISSLLFKLQLRIEEERKNNG